jgi:hypothetical protein
MDELYTMGRPRQMLILPVRLRQSLGWGFKRVARLPKPRWLASDTLLDARRRSQVAPFMLQLRLAICVQLGERQRQ